MENDLEDDRLYRVVTGMYSAQMLDTVKDRSFGLLSIVPKDEYGEPVTDFPSASSGTGTGMRSRSGTPWRPILRSFGEERSPQ